MIRRPPRSTQSRSSAASDVYKRQRLNCAAEAHPSPVRDLRVAGDPSSCSRPPRPPAELAVSCGSLPARPELLGVEHPLGASSDPPHEVGLVSQSRAPPAQP